MINQKNGYFGIRSFAFVNRFASLVKGDSPLCGEMSRNDRGDKIIGPIWASALYFIGLIN